eukprot:529822_1
MYSNIMTGSKCHGNVIVWYILQALMEYFNKFMDTFMESFEDDGIFPSADDGIFSRYIYDIWNYVKLSDENVSTTIDRIIVTIYAHMLALMMEYFQCKKYLWNYFNSFMLVFEALVMEYCQQLIIVFEALMMEYFQQMYVLMEYMELTYRNKLYRMTFDALFNKTNH